MTGLVIRFWRSNRRLFGCLPPAMRTGEHANQSCRACRKAGMGGAHFGQASLSKNSSGGSRSTVRRTNPRSTPYSSQNRSQCRLATAGLPHGIAMSLSLYPYPIWQFIVPPPHKPVHMNASQRRVFAAFALEQGGPVLAPFGAGVATGRRPRTCSRPMARLPFLFSSAAS